MLLSLLKNSWSYVLVAAIAALITYKLLPPRIEEKLVTEVKERVVTRTRIIERPDGTKETIIDEKKDTKFNQEYSKTPANKDLTIFVGSSVYSDDRSEPVHTIGVSKEVLFGIKIGAYGRTDKEVGILLSYDF